ncbi:hypothetical protein [Streptomyces canus]|uniref:hypothetical protein n=1 Tax=Streptomyces canus TaxID=58343 RepID=UPI0030E2F0AE
MPRTHMPLPEKPRSKHEVHRSRPGSSIDIAAYFYGEQTVCPDCVKDLAIPYYQISNPDRSTEDILNEAALKARIDRHGEDSFNSHEFPKVIFASDIAGGDYCFVCLRSL